MITKKSLAYIAAVQLAFSAIDIYARSSLRLEASFFDAVTHEWFFVWLFLHACVAPFQIRLITGCGIGRGVVLMNAFSVLYAVLGGYLLLHEVISVQQGIAALLVVLAVALMLSASMREESSLSEGFFNTQLGDLSHEVKDNVFHPPRPVDIAFVGVGHVRFPEHGVHCDTSNDAAGSGQPVQGGAYLSRAFGRQVDLVD